MSVRIVKTGQHNCRLPFWFRKRRFGMGAVIKCDTCNENWTLKVGHATGMNRWYRQSTGEAR